MRIAAGRFRGRRLVTPQGAATRPTGARVREAVFDILVHGEGFRLAGATVLDVFAGAGALGLEALSRGAGSVTFIERAGPAGAAIAANIEALGATAEARLISADATRPPPCSGRPADLVFLDPPYGQGLEAGALAALVKAGWLAAGALVTVEHATGDEIAIPPGFEAVDRRTYGTSAVLFLRYRGGD